MHILPKLSRISSELQGQGTSDELCFISTNLSRSDDSIIIPCICLSEVSFLGLEYNTTRNYLHYMVTRGFIKSPVHAASEPAFLSRKGSTRDYNRLSAS